jgi:hypothetical protein
MADAAALPMRPIEEAPIRQGKRSVPCLVSPGYAGHSHDIGVHDGYSGWFTQDGEHQLQPQKFLLLV